MSSKVEYLSKYIQSGDDKTRSKSKKSKKSNKHERPVAKDSNATINSRRVMRLYDIDNEDDLVIPQTKGSPTDSEAEDAEQDDGPVVVGASNTDEMIVSRIKTEHVPRGAWEDEPTHSSNLMKFASTQSEIRRPRKRHDSDTDEKPMTHKRNRQRHDSSDDDSPERHHPKQTRRQRHDSDDGNDATGASSSNRQLRHDSDSSSSNPDNVTDKLKSPPRQRRRYDTSSDDDPKHSLGRRRRRRYDSSDSSDCNDSKSTAKNNVTKERMASGHQSGVQTGTDFSRREARLQQQKRRVNQEFVQKHGTTGETVYRDHKSGIKLDETQIKQKHNSNDKKEKVALSAEEQRVLNAGQAQLEREEQLKHEFAVLHESTFARHRDDTELDTLLKNEIRADDPMATYAMKKVNVTLTGDEMTSTGKPQPPPMYKGPAPKPNRFGIPPGYRWDARDRGNGFEDKLLAKKYNADYQKERAYRYSSADM
jgi:pre-mRNA-splicing factor CWC26